MRGIGGSGIRKPRRWWHGIHPLGEKSFWGKIFIHFMYLFKLKSQVFYFLEWSNDWHPYAKSSIFEINASVDGRYGLVQSELLRRWVVGLGCEPWMRFRYEKLRRMDNIKRKSVSLSLFFNIALITFWFFRNLPVAPFCRQIKSGNKPLDATTTCTLTRRSIGLCNLKYHDRVLMPEYQVWILLFLILQYLFRNFFIFSIFRLLEHAAKIWQRISEVQ